MLVGKYRGNRFRYSDNDDDMYYCCTCKTHPNMCIYIFISEFHLCKDINAYIGTF